MSLAQTPTHRLSCNISFRNHLFGSVEDFVRASQMHPFVTARTVANMIVALSRYTEEGKSFSPEIYLTDGIDELLKFVPGSVCIPVGKCPVSEEAPTFALKQCAPLAIDGWCIYANCNGGDVSYGLFRDSLTPLSVPLDEVVLDQGTEGVKIVRVHQSALNCVDVSNHLGDRHTIFLSQRSERDPSPRQFVNDLAVAACRDVDQAVKEQTQTLVRKVLNNGLDECHGALIAITAGKKLPTFLKDGLKLEPPITIKDLVKDAIEGTEAQRLKLLSYCSVIRGMFGCDGIVVFNPQAAILGYKFFITTHGGKRQTPGGARRRAFDSLRARIGKDLSAAYIRSHDGISEFISI